MIKKIWLILLFFPLALLAQKEKTHEFPRLRWGIEAGIETFDGKILKNPNIRENRSYSYYEYYYGDSYLCGFMYNFYEYNRYYVGFKPEYSFDHHIVGAAGLRFSFNKSKLDSDRDFFLWRVSEENLTTNYVRVSNVHQNNFYAGIPLEIKLFPSTSDMRVRQYFKAGMLFNFLVASHNSTTFADNIMKKYADKISDQMGKPSFQSGYFYLGIGFKFGRMDHPFGSIEMQIPISVFKDKKLASFIGEPEAGVGLQATFYIPAGKKKLSYNYR